MIKEDQSILARYVVNVALNLVAGFAGFLAIMLITREFGAAGFGRISLSLSILAYAEIVTICGTDVYAVTSAAARPSAIVSVARLVLALRVPLAIFSYLAVMVVTWAVPAFRDNLSLMAIFGLALLFTSTTPSWIAQAMHRTGAYTALGTVAPCVYLATLYAATRISSSIVVVPMCMVASYAAANAFSWIWVRRHIVWSSGAITVSEVRGLFRSSSPLGLARLFRGLALGSDIILLGLVLGPVDLGHYSAAYKIFTFMLTLSGTYFVILLPRLAERAGVSTQLMDAELKASLWRVLPVVSAGAMVILIIAAPLLRVAFGENFVNAAPALRWLAIAFAAQIVHRHYIQALVARGLRDLDMSFSIIAAVLHIALKGGLIVWLGITGAAIGSAVSELVMAGIYIAANRSKGRYTRGSTGLP